MVTKLIPPDLGALEEDQVPSSVASLRPDLRLAPRRSEAKVDLLVQEGFVTEAVLPEPTEPGDTTEVLTIEVPRRLKRALLAEVAERRDDPERRAVASMKSLILEALTTYGFGHLIKRADIEVQAGIFMKRQAAQLRRR